MKDDDDDSKNDWDYKMDANINTYMSTPPPRLNHSAGARGYLDLFFGLPAPYVLLPFVIPLTGLKFRDLD